MAITFEATYEDGMITPDPLDAVIGVGRTGPDISLAAAHDRITYGLK